MSIGAVQGRTVGDTARQQWADDIDRQLDALPPAQRCAVRLVYGRGLVVDEVAAILELTVRETSKAVAEALQTLGRATGHATSGAHGGHR